jgi:aminopeptidase
MMPEWANWTAKLQGTSEVHLKGKNTDLRMSIKDRSWSAPSARGNMPGVETFTSPWEDTLNGHVWFENPGVLGGRLMHDIYLEWKEVNWSRRLLRPMKTICIKILSTDAGAARSASWRSAESKPDQVHQRYPVDENVRHDASAVGRAYKKQAGPMNQPSIDIIKDRARR